MCTARSAQADSEKFLKYGKSRKSARKSTRPLDVEGVKGMLGNHRMLWVGRDL